MYTCTSVHQSGLIDSPIFLKESSYISCFYNHDFLFPYFSEQPCCWTRCDNYMYFMSLLWFYLRYSNRPVMSVPGLYDPTEVMNANVMSRCQKEGWIKLTFFLLCFFYYLYRYVTVDSTQTERIYPGLTALLKWTAFHLVSIFFCFVLTGNASHSTD